MRVRLRQLLLSLVVCGAVAGPAAAGTAPGEDADHLRRLFDSLDKDHDGQLRRAELRQYLLGTDSSYAEGSSNKLDAAVSGAMQRLDSPDVGLGVSETELEQHLHTVLQGVSVADWVAHGLGLPQYAEAFRTNSITVLDLPMLVNDGGQLLQSELKVESPLHRQQLLRAMQRQILGLGQPPGPLHHLQCSTVSGIPHTGAAAAAQHHAGSTPEPTGVGAPAAAAEAPAAAAAVAVVCSWLPPADAGQPGMHKYVLQRVDHSGQSALWQTVAELHDSLSVRFRDVPPRPGLYQYRLSAWNVYGRSPYTLSYDVAVPDQRPAAAAAAAAGGSGNTAVTAPGPVGVPAAAAAAAVAHHADLLGHAASAAAAASEQQQQQAGSCGDGVGNSADLCRPDSLVVPYHQQRPVGQPTVSSSTHSFGSACDPSNGSQQGPGDVLAQQFTAVQGFGGSSQQNPSGGVVWLVGLDPNQPWSQNTPATPAGRAAQQHLAESMRAAAAAGDQNSLGASAASAPGFGSNSSQAPATTARLVALLGSAWHSSMGSWLKALANSLAAFLLVVFPICVRLLPVHVLAQAAQMLAWVLHFLPAQLRQRLLLRGRQATPLPPPQQQQQQLLAASGPVLLQESESLLGGSSSSGRLGSDTPEGLRSRASPVAVSQSLGLAASALSVGGHLASKEVAASPPDVVLSPDGVAASPAAAVAAVPAAVPAAAAGARRRLMPRSVSEFDMVKHTRSASPAAIRACSATGSPYGSSPVKHSVMLAGGSPGPARAGWAAPGAGSSGGGSVQLDRAAAAVAAACLSQSGVEAAAVGSVHEEVERELQYLLQCGAHGSALPDNKQCCFPGCQQQFGLRHWKATMQRHYCGRCQQAFCLQHTVYSPHGASGTCGVQSRCLCIDCFYEYTPEYQAFLASRNTLTGKRSRSGPPGAAGVAGGSIGPGSSSSSSSMTAGGSRSATGMLSRLVPQSLNGSQRQAAAPSSSSAGSAGIGGELVAPAPAGRALSTCQTAAGAADVPDADASAVAAGPAEPAQRHTPAAEQQEAALSVKRQQPLVAGPTGPSAGSNSRMLWGRGMTKALGVVRFKHAGDVHAAASSGAAGVSGGMGSGAVTDRTV